MPVARRHMLLGLFVAVLLVCMPASTEAASKKKKSSKKSSGKNENNANGVNGQTSSQIIRNCGPGTGGYYVSEKDGKIFCHGEDDRKYPGDTINAPQQPVVTLLRGPRNSPRVVQVGQQYDFYVAISNDDVDERRINMATFTITGIPLRGNVSVLAVEQIAGANTGTATINAGNITIFSNRDIKYLTTAEYRIRVNITAIPPSGFFPWGAVATRPATPEWYYWGNYTQRFGGNFAVTAAFPTTAPFTTAGVRVIATPVPEVSLNAPRLPVDITIEAYPSKVTNGKYESNYIKVTVINTSNKKYLYDLDLVVDTSRTTRLISRQYGLSDPEVGYAQDDVAGYYIWPFTSVKGVKQEFELYYTVRPDITGTITFDAFVWENGRFDPALTPTNPTRISRTVQTSIKIKDVVTAEDQNTDIFGNENDKSHRSSSNMHL